MAKDNTILILAAAGVGIFALTSMNKSSKRGSVEVPNPETVVPGSEDWTNQPDAVVDTAETGGNVGKAVAAAQAIAETLQDANIVIKHEGNPIAAIRKGLKRLKPGSKRAKKSAKIKAKKYKKPSKKTVKWGKKNIKTTGWGF